MRLFELEAIFHETDLPALKISSIVTFSLVWVGGCLGGVGVGGGLCGCWGFFLGGFLFFGCVFLLVF